MNENEIMTQALRYMGWKGEPDAAVSELLGKAYKELSERLSPADCYKCVPKSDAIHLLLGNDIQKHVEGCERVIILAATLGAEADRLIRTAQISNMAYALALDALSNALIEERCDRLEERIKAAVPGSFTWRYSPGYGDYPISVQSGLIKFLNADKLIGLTVTQSDILIPKKSVTAVIGVSGSGKVGGKRRGCAECNLKDTCAYRKSGTTCETRV